MPALEDINTFNFSSDQEDADEEADMNNMDTTIQVSPTPTIRIHKDHPLDQEELLQFKLQEVWTLVDLPYGKRAIGTKWVFQNKKNKREVKNRSTPMDTQKPLLKDEDGEEVDVHMYRSMIGSLMYLTSSRPDIMYLKGQPKFSLWYPKDSHFDLVVDTNSDYAGASLDRNLQQPTESEGFEQIVDFLNANPIQYALTVNPIVYTSCIEQFWAIVKVKTVNEEGQLQALVDEKKLTLMRKLKRKDTELPQTSVPTRVVDEAINEEMDDNLEKVATTATSLDAEQDNGGGPRCQKAMGDTVAQTRVLDLETTKTTQAMEIESLKRRVKKLKNKQRLGEDDASKQRRIADIDSSEDIYLVNVHKDKYIFSINDSDGDEVIVEDTEMLFDVVNDLRGKKVFVAQQDEKVVEKEINATQVQVTTAATTPTISIDEATLAQALAELKHAKLKTNAKGIVFHEPEESTITTIASIPKLKSQDNGKAKMIEEPIKLKKKDQIQLDKEVALRLQDELKAEFKKEQRLAVEKAQQELETNIALIES
uniref:Uncharacterized protein n=1 Tax=Tanacetum cinerariifolium TaxID=118510 RepID=A0A6L2K134_TANCI|nr:hypothetical protein [Tanacetum cinerariifolium]